MKWTWMNLLKNENKKCVKGQNVVCIAVHTVRVKDAKSILAVFDWMQGATLSNLGVIVHFLRIVGVNYNRPGGWTPSNICSSANDLVKYLSGINMRSLHDIIISLPYGWLHFYSLQSHVNFLFVLTENVLGTFCMCKFHAFLLSINLERKWHSN